MTILSNDVIGNYVAITPIKAIFTDIVDCNSLVAIIVNDNLTDACVIRYDLYNLVTTIDPITNTAQLMYSDTIVINGADYFSWAGDCEFVYTYIASKIPIILI